ncbi:MAG: maleylpyruvate isomerase family mycothiol-dependent enzyme [Micrococcales bacterium]|nr:maleylpyruvate isomerase family mycothiol-dependent enzyme [Micrococcales bacterium]
MPVNFVPAQGSLPFLDHLRQESARFREVLADAPAGAPVPTCPDWEADDLLWHLADVQWFWGQIAEDRLTRGEQIGALEQIRPRRPDDRAGLLACYDVSSARLHRVLSEIPAETELWMWAEDHSAGYILRRQAHEALIHRVDAELTAGADRSPMDSGLAADGVDEALRIMRGYEQEAGFTATPMGAKLTIAGAGGEHAWTVTPVRVQGIDEKGSAWDVQRFLVVDGPDDEAAAEISGTTADLDCWLWSRPTVGVIERHGDPVALAALDAVLAEAIG